MVVIVMGSLHSGRLRAEFGSVLQHYSHKELGMSTYVIRFSEQIYKWMNEWLPANTLKKILAY